jgi:glutathione synthase
MHIAFIVDPLPKLKPAKDSSIALMRCAEARGHHIFAIEAGALQRTSQGVEAWSIELATVPGPHWYTPIGPGESRRLASFDAVLMRQDPPFDLEYLYATHLLSLAEEEGAKIFNRPSAIRNHNEKLGALKFPQWTPESIVSRDVASLRAFIETHGDTIVKPLDGMGGQGIFRVRRDDPNLSVILEVMSLNGQTTLMAQVYLPEIVDGDKRVLLIDGIPCPFALARIPPSGETRGNLAAGGRGVARPLNASDRAIAEAIGPYAKEQGLLIVGLDVIGEKLTEFNVTSPTCMVEIFEQTGFDVAEMTISALERRIG